MVDEKNSFQSHYEHQGFVSRDQSIYLQHHKPADVVDPFHFHPSIELNFLQSCDMTYSFSGSEFVIERGHFCVFWAAYPHRSASVNDDGVITNVYISLSEFLQWRLPGEFVNTLLSGAVLSTKTELDGDKAIAERWAQEIDQTDLEWQKVHLCEVQARLRRMALEGWTVLHKPDNQVVNTVIGHNAIIQFEKMLRFVAQNFANPITIKDVAEVAGITPNYAISLFQKMLGRSIKSHITDTRVVHAKMLLSATNEKIYTIALNCGFGSISAFYASFAERAGMPPAAFRNRGTVRESVNDQQTNSEDTKT